MNKDVYYIWLQLVFGINNNEVFKLLDKFKDPQVIYENIDDTFKILSNKYISKAKNTSIYIAYNMMDKIFNNFYDIISIDSEYYPSNLRNIYSPPLVLYASKNFKHMCECFSITIVGARKPTRYGIESTKFIVDGLVKENVVTISGLAYGIDKVVHEETMNKNGRTIAVLPNGINKTYPISNVNLRKRIEENGAVVTEFYYDTMAYKGNFIHRNRILAGLSSGTVITEASLKSGTLITAKHAFSENRDVFCVPSSIFSNLNGTNELIKNYGKLITSSYDMLKEYNYIKPSNDDDKTNCKKDVEVTKIQETILNALTFEPMYIDDILLKTGLTVNEITENIFYLEMMDLIISHSGKRYTIKF